MDLFDLLFFDKDKEKQQDDYGLIGQNFSGLGKTSPTQKGIRLALSSTIHWEKPRNAPLPPP